MKENVSWDDEIMKSEIFGPVLPVLSYDDTDDMIEKINSIDTPLAFYIFSMNRRLVQKYLMSISLRRRRGK